MLTNNDLGCWFSLLSQRPTSFCEVINMIKIVLEFEPIDASPDELGRIIADLERGWAREDMYPVVIKHFFVD